MVQTRRSARVAAGGEPVSQPAAAKEPVPAQKPTHKRQTKKRPKEESVEHEASPTAGAAVEEEHVQEDEHKPAKRRRATRMKKEPEVYHPEDFRPRVSSPWKIGAHVSAAGGVQNTVINAARVGANAFALFVKSQRKWTSPPLTEENITSFKVRMQEFGYSPAHVLPHGSYLINLGNPDEVKREKSYECFLDDLRRCELLGLQLYNFHPGSTVGKATKEESISFIAQCINNAHKATSFITIVIENMAGAGNIIGSEFTDLRDIIHQVEDKSRVGVCLDTCHMFAAGYDISTKEGWDRTLSTFDTQVGLSYLKGMHLNDSKLPLGSKRDRHENIGLGHLSLPAFRHITTDPRVQNLPLILETPTFEAIEVWEREIGVLYRLGPAVDGEDAGSSGDREEKVLLEDIRTIVRHSSNGKEKPKAKPRKRRKQKGRQRAADEEDGDTDGDDDGDGDGEHDHEEDGQYADPRTRFRTTLPRKRPSFTCDSHTDKRLLQ